MKLFTVQLPLRRGLQLHCKPSLVTRQVAPTVYDADFGFSRAVHDSPGAPATSSTSRLDPSYSDAVSLGKDAQKALAEGNFDEEKWERFAASAANLAPSMTLAEVAKLSAAFSTARMVDFGLFSLFSSRALENIENDSAAVRPLELRRLALAFGRARAFDSDLMHALVPCIAERASDFRPRELARIVDAYSRMPVPSAELFALAADLLPPYLFDLEPAELARLGRSFSDAAFYNQELFDAICAEVSKRLRTFGALECLNFLESLAQVHKCLPDDLRRNDDEVVSEVARRVSVTCGSLSANELVRLFSALVHLSHYDRQLVHGKICAGISVRIDQLQVPNAFVDMAELLHCLSLLPAQSHKSADLAGTVIARLRQVGLPSGRIVPKALASIAAALAQLGQDDEDLLILLADAVARRDIRMPIGGVFGTRTSTQDLLSLATDEELTELHRAYGLSKSATAISTLHSARSALKAEVARRESVLA